MRVMITGGVGLIGRAAAAHLLARGHEVHLTDLSPETNVPHTTYAPCDMLDFDAVREQVRGCDAVVHMAALRSPLHAPGQEVVRINATGTFNVFEAAAKEGIRRVVQASSINALGCAWNTGDFTPLYLPVDEAHPTATSDPYSFSKQQVEAIGDYFWRRDHISSVALRLPGIYVAEARPGGAVGPSRSQAMRAFLDDFVQLPPEEQARQMAAVRQAALAFRVARRMEYPETSMNSPALEGIDPRLVTAYTFDRYNLWASLDVRDAALAIERGLIAEFDGSYALFVSNPHNWLNYDSETLARLFFPDVTARKRLLPGNASLVDVTKARDLIGFTPAHAPHGGYHA